MLIETDVLLAAINPRDPARRYALKMLDQGNLRLSPYSLLEIHLLNRAEKLSIQNFKAFADDLSALFEMQKITTLSDRPEYHAQASTLESRFKLTFFDSLHAAVAKVEKEIIVSFDRSYDRISGTGVKRIDPREL